MTSGVTNEHVVEQGSPRIPIFRNRGGAYYTNNEVDDVTSDISLN